MNDIYQYERSELAQVRAQLLHLFFIVGIFSFLVNLLLLTGPLYMLHIYDRVLPSGAVQTLVALSLMACLAYAVMGVLDHTRARITARIAVRFLTQLDQRVFSLAMASPAKIVRRAIFILFKFGIGVDIGIVSNVFQFKTAALEIYQPRLGVTIGTSIENFINLGTINLSFL